MTEPIFTFKGISVEEAKKMAAEKFGTEDLVVTLFSAPADVRAIEGSITPRGSAKKLRGPILVITLPDGTVGEFPVPIKEVRVVPNDPTVKTFPLEWTFDIELDCEGRQRVKPGSIRFAWEKTKEPDTKPEDRLKRKPTIQ